MKYQVIYAAKARDDLKNMELSVAKRIIKKVCFYSATEDPLSFAKPLTGTHLGEYRFRVGDYRILFDCDKKGDIRVLKILRIKHRRDVYL